MPHAHIIISCNLNRRYLMRSQIESSIRTALLKEGRMEYSLYELELEKHIDYWYEVLKASRNDLILAIAESSGDVAIAVVLPDGTALANEEARAKLLELWQKNYRENLKAMIPVMAEELEKHLFYVTEVKTAATKKAKRKLGKTRGF